MRQNWRIWQLFGVTVENIHCMAMKIYEEIAFFLPSDGRIYNNRNAHSVGYGDYWASIKGGKKQRFKN